MPYFYCTLIADIATDIMEAVAQQFMQELKAQREAFEQAQEAKDRDHREQFQTQKKQMQALIQQVNTLWNNIADGTDGAGGTGGGGAPVPVPAPVAQA